jgi:uncharacterized protein YkwD
MKRASSLSPTRFPVLIVLSLSLLIGLAPITTRSQTQTGGDDYALSDLERAVLQEMNQARTDPRAYASYLEAMRKYYKGKNYVPPTGRSSSTIEGVSGLDEAIKFLQTAKPLPPLQISKGMCMGAKDQSFDQSQSGAISHQGSDKSFSWDRVARYGEWKTPVSENIAYDSGTARDIVINLIIDDGVPSRGHRNNIFNGSYIVTGVSCDKHPLFGGMCVCTFAGGFTEKSSQNKGAATTTGQPASPGQTGAPKARKL